MKKIAIVRPYEQALESMEKLPQYKCVPLSFAKVIKYNILNDQNSANLHRYQYIIITSQNAALQLIENREKFNPETIVIAVGDKTASCLSKYFKVISASGEAANITSYILNVLPRHTEMLYLRGKDISTDLKAILREYNIVEQIVYALEYKDSPIPDDVINAEAFLFYSQNSAKFFLKMIDKYHSRNHSLQHAYTVSISLKVLNILKPLCSKGHFYADSPSEKDMFTILSKII